MWSVFVGNGSGREHTAKATHPAHQQVCEFLLCPENVAKLVDRRLEMSADQSPEGLHTIAQMRIESLTKVALPARINEIELLHSCVMCLVPQILPVKRPLTHISYFGSKSHGD